MQNNSKYNKKATTVEHIRTCADGGERLSWDELGAVNELGEICARGV